MRSSKEIAAGIGGGGRGSGVLGDEQVTAAAVLAVVAAAHDRIAANVRPVREGCLTDSVTIAGRAGAEVDGVIGAGRGAGIGQRADIFVPGSGADNIIEYF